MCAATLNNHYGGYNYVSNALIVEQEAGEEVCMKTTGGKSAFSHFNKSMIKHLLWFLYVYLQINDVLAAKKFDNL